MLRGWAAQFIAAYVCATFGIAPGAATAARLTINVAGLKRTAVFVEHAPLKLARRPLVIVLHGANSSGGQVRRRLKLETIASSDKPIFLYPDAIRGHWPQAEGVDARRDIAMLRAFIARLVRLGLVNSRMIFLVGYSTGGALAIRAACSGLGQPIAGLATIDMTLSAVLSTNCATAQPLAYIDVNGDDVSQVSHQNGKIETNPLSAAVVLFAKLDRCTTEPLPAPLVVVDPLTGKVASARQFPDCKAPVEQVRIKGDGKATSVETSAPKDRAPKLTEKNNVDAAHSIWAFLKKLGA